jgi:hypothetical protein
MKLHGGSNQWRKDIKGENTLETEATRTGKQQATWLLWCSALRHHQFCANNFPLSDLILKLFFPLVKMLLSPRGTKALEGFLFESKLNE